MVVMQTLPNPMYCQLIRIYPVANNTSPCLRFELTSFKSGSGKKKTILDVKFQNSRRIETLMDLGGRKRSVSSLKILGEYLKHGIQRRKGENDIPFDHEI